ncbi:ATP-dependent DNA helicase RecG [uncultured Campylobacter sp.]|uniref:ATP-dependent DNA helicase RecG n=1 Tax=uncultured Campylobacter sp. TaxID=218934 RepID=UPI002620B314|nr:ATP-dependent DNA helicase RecG [uncultured Campylobacter sp.]
MRIESKDRAKLAPYGIESILDIALVLPKSFLDLSLTPTPKEGVVTVWVVIKEFKFLYNRAVVSAFCKTWQMPLNIVIFNARAWHGKVFGVGKELFIHSNATFYGGALQVTNPKVITKVGEITPVYREKIPSFKKYVDRYVTRSNLENLGLRDDECELLLGLHKSDKKSIELLDRLKSDDRLLNIVKFVEIYNYILKLSQKKQHFRANFSEPKNIDEWLAKLPFKPTNDQLLAIDEIKNDLKSPMQKRRVVMGDVGSGKTLIMLAAALMAQKAALMAPTTILAEQIYQEAKRLLPSDFNIVLVTSEQKQDFSDFNLIIGTHALLFLELPPLPLVMVDEQHRFGSSQRAKIEKLTRDGEFRAHFLQFSATPIPRTLSLIESELVEFSFLKELPFKKDIRTVILTTKGFSLLLKHLKDEMAKGRQAIIVYPLVNESQKSLYQSLEEGSWFWLKNFPNVYITHGKDREKEEILREFRDSGNLLLTTTLVEVGISLPRLSTIVIVGAERFGLATLHQLRGRVARHGGVGYCYLFTKLKEPPARLVEFSKTLDGFVVAKIDLQNRKSGDILSGVYQHGESFSFYNYEEEITLLAKKRAKTWQNRIEI